MLRLHVVRSRNDTVRSRRTEHLRGFSVNTETDTTRQRRTEFVVELRAGTRLFNFCSSSLLSVNLNKDTQERCLTDVEVHQSRHQVF